MVDNVNRLVGLREAAQLVGVAPWRLTYSITAGHVSDVQQIAGRRLFGEADIDRLRRHFGTVVPLQPGDST